MIKAGQKVKMKLKDDLTSVIVDKSLFVSKPASTAPYLL